MAHAGIFRLEDDVVEGKEKSPIEKRRRQYKSGRRGAHGNLRCIAPHSNDFGLGGKRLRTVSVVMASRPNIINETARIVQPNPMRGINLLIIIGMTTPPSDEPASMTAKANARRRRNHGTTDDMQALNTAEEPKDATTPWERKN